MSKETYYPASKLDEPQTFPVIKKNKVKAQFPGKKTTKGLDIDRKNKIDRSDETGTNSSVSEEYRSGGRSRFDKGGQGNFDDFDLGDLTRKEKRARNRQDFSDPRFDSMSQRSRDFGNKIGIDTSKLDKRAGKNKLLNKLRDLNNRKSQKSQEIKDLYREVKRFFSIH